MSGKPFCDETEEKEREGWTARQGRVLPMHQAACVIDTIDRAELRQQATVVQEAAQRQQRKALSGQAAEQQPGFRTGVRRMSGRRSPAAGRWITYVRAA